jgi:ATP-binding cassette subfamily B protein
MPADRAEPAPEPTSHAPGEADGGAAAPRKERQSLGPLRMVAPRWPIRGGWRWRAGADRHRQHHGGVPYGFRQVVDKGFARGSDPATINHWFLLLAGAGGGAGHRHGGALLQRIWLGERVVADIRLAVQRNLLRQPPSFFEANSPKEIASRMTADTALIEQVVGTTVSVALRNSSRPSWASASCSSWRPN